MARNKLQKMKSVHISKAIQDKTFLENLQTAKERIAAPGYYMPDPYKKDKQGRTFMDIKEVRETSMKTERETSLQWHKNDPNIRLDDCDFPKDRQDRGFLLSHDFGLRLNFLTEIITKGRKDRKGKLRNWAYLHGQSGLGKTAICIRAIWEVMKKDPAAKATYISINAWVNDQMLEGSQTTPPLRKLVLLDDFDKFNTRKEFQVRAVLRLVEQLKDRDSHVLLTTQLDLSTFLNKNPDSIDFEVMLDRVRGKSIMYKKFRGESLR